MMKALRFHGQKDIRLDDVPIPQCGRGQVKVKPAYVGICGTDLHEYLGGANIMPTVPHPITNEKVPLTLGHEFSGVVEEVGEGVYDIKVGAKVTIQPIIYDGTCGACRDGYINCCDNNGFVGLSGWGGGLSEHVVVPRKAVYEIPENVSMEVAALVEPLAVAWHAVNISPFKKGDSVLILGGGPIGLAVIQTLKARGAEKIIVSEMAPRRMEFAKKFGAHYVLDPSKDDVVARVKEICDGRGVNVAFDAAGVQAGLDQAIQAIRARGTLVNIAIWEKTATITPNWLCFRERKYMGVATYQEGDFQDVLDAISSGKLQPASMITRKIQMDEVEEKGFKALVNDKDNHVKILVEVSP
ncbi:hypothetical protein HO173_005841 [Letharia columbiana]|uniref:Enoyl reductase (ER) domain-containing protein n=1 Tax=Letharia columbiana TaxID=112416 RepID=A0A8H6L5D2_9LECA|nr:uncharacterized protein HO173_005841 [Letharia columbiana]KAF6236211.1 hypothetical protein HO173_005841 [Letharia columbiana]